ncbi:glycine zipper 2TM domain-containing protein [Montanilutibacter psychrotolerans]|uniref:Glycine zipper 2TM domain-containing protein n=1 Tax=Montanilutibacter psychrotolerans TaxID=1327343 RepID=A0A3M8T3I7_9GAMM|nr:glycine zipper 2TM domain-containing protein [Lysobacter psychrotolerans]RNF86104.1 glycine zipper 2TM domain-containing protein [Lysobacter psychrotolerans]
MKRLLVSTLALGLAVVTSVASAQTYGQPDYGYDGYPRTGNVYPDRTGNDRHAQYDYARVVRVDPVIDARYGQSTPRGSYINDRGQRCYENRSNGYDDSYQASYPDNGYYGGDYRDPRQDGYYDRNGDYRRNTGGTETGRNVATIVGGIAGAVLGSKVGGGSGSYATAAIGSMVGGMAGRSIYNQTQRPRNRVGTVVSCDSYPDRNNYYRTGGYDNGDYATGGSGVSAYDVTYEYAGRHYTTRTAYHPGERIRVRVDVRPE